IKRRRLWVGLAPREDGQPGTVVEIAGLARTDSAGWGTEFNRTTERILGLEEEDLDDEHNVSSGSWEEDFGDGLDEQLRDRSIVFAGRCHYPPPLECWISRFGGIISDVQEMRLGRRMPLVR